MTTLFLTTSFLAAALLFLMQPMVGRMVLPAFGGSPQVWTTSMLFFQVALLAGYGYAHGATARIAPRRQPWVHIALAALPLALLPVALDVVPSGAGGLAPARELLGALTLGAGLPFLVVATSGPLLQRWLSWTDHRAAGDPYFLYAAGNLGSAAGLVSYPFVVEPLLSVADQSRAWTLGYGILLLLLAACAWHVARRSVTPIAHAADDQSAARVGWRRALRWTACAFVPSSLMLCVTTLVSTDIAAVPLIWVIPLGLYLLTFTAAFSRFGPALLTVARALAVPVALAAVLVDTVAFDPLGALGVQLALVAVGGLACHGMLAADRPPAAQLTRFYLVLAIGGALGGLFNGIIAPVVFDGFVEHGLSVTLLVALVVLGPRATPKGLDRVGLAVGAVAIPLVLAGITDRLPEGAIWTVLTVTVALIPMLTSYARNPVMIAAILVIGLVGPVAEESRASFTTRTFFGRYQVTESDGVALLTNGTTVHGRQDQTSAEARLRPTAYYDRRGPLGAVMDVVRGDVGVIGLGAGTIAAYGQPGQTIVFHEIDPAVIEIARSRFSFVDDSPARIEMVLGDGRLTVDRTPRRYDLLIVDGFTSDAIPIHLLTLEAFQAYSRALTERGLIAVHISNRHFRLEPVLRGIADQLGLIPLLGVGMSADNIASVWVVLFQTPDRVDYLRDRGWVYLGGRAELWTDQRSSLVSVLFPEELPQGED